MSQSSAPLRYEAHASFLRILDAAGCTLAISVYMQNRVVLVSVANDVPQIDAFPFPRPMGIGAALSENEVRLAIATFQEVVVLADAPLLAPALPDNPGRYEHLLVPRAVIFSGDIDAHDLVWVGNRLFAANTRFSCIAEIDGRCSFTPLWTPPFVTQIMPEDRCHLNGLAAAEGRIAYATAFSQSDEPRGWKDTRLTSGLLMEVPSGRVVLDNLCMPHSPRLFGGELYLLESGRGGVLRVEAGRAVQVASLPGFTRGLDCLGDTLFVGLSRLRDRAAPGPPIADSGEPLMCGIAAVERRTGQTLGFLRFDEIYEEIFDIKVIPNCRRAGMLGVDEERHRRALVLPGRAFWGEKIDQNQGF
jgi:uncharacterized protein (TIGR03032 family)